MKTLLMICLLLLPSLLTAGQVVLKNGDRLTGTILRSDSKELLLKTEYAGEVKIQWDAVASVSSEETLYVTSKTQQTLVGPVTTAAEQFIVETPDSGAVPVDIQDVEAIRSQEAFAAYQRSIERLRDPSLLDFWSGYIDTAVATAQGNANTFTWANAAEATRRTSRDKISVNFVSIYTRAKTEDGQLEATANAIRGATRYDINFTPKMFGFGGLNLEFDKFQQLDLRAVVLGGMGYHVIKSEPTVFDLFAGGTYNTEFFETLTRRSAEVVIGDELAHQFNDRFAVTQRLAVYPNISRFGEYRFQFDLGIVTKINSLLNWQITFSDRFQSNPISGVKTNDTLLSTGIRLVFANPLP